MLTPIVRIEEIRALREAQADPAEIQRLRDRSLLFSATLLALESAYTYGRDFPVGAVAAAGDWINGRYFASDKRTGYRQTHAEYMAVQDASLDIALPHPDTIVVTMEPCDRCQDFLATVPSIKRVGFGIPRRAVEERGIVKPHGETIFERAERLRLPYEVVHIQYPLLERVGGIILDHVARDPISEVLEVDAARLAETLSTLSAN